ncbi:MAG: hypothetical protein CALGDGBN_02724 [Pseudomonadales bacterium]|nr:hypothetical protein [Pseudomonadales bacterium]
MHMNQKSRLGLAAAVVAVMVALVVVFGYRDQRGGAGAGQHRWLPELAPRLAQVERVRLRSAVGVVTLVRDGERWGIEERGGYRTDFTALQALLDALASARLIEQKTAQPEYFDRLGLADVEQPDSEAVQVEIWAGEAQPLVRVLIGNEGGARGGRFVRAADELQTWLIDTAPLPLAEPADWLDRSLLGVDFARVAAVERELGGERAFRATRASAQGDASLAAESLPAGKAPRYVSVFDAAARSILTLEPEDVRKAAEIDFSAAALTRIVCFDGLTIEARAVKGADGNWMSLAARFDASPARPEPGADSAQTAGSGAVAQQPDPATGARVEAERLAARLDGWAFRTSDYVHGEATKGLADYIQDLKPAAAPAPANGEQTDDAR